MPDDAVMPPGSPAPQAGASPGESAAFVLCIENNETRGQALLLIESLRAFGGRFAASRVFAVAPRSGLGVDAPTRARLDALEATYHEAPLNTVCPEYGSANRVYAAAWAAGNCLADTLFVLDSDTLFLGEPESLAPGWDLAARPVDVKGPTSEGPGDPFEPYWAAMCGLAGMSIEALPFVETVFDRRRVRASYNGGYTVVRRSSGLLERTADLFTRSVEAGLRPYQGMPSPQVFASTGEVPSLAAEYWGSNQAALSIAAGSMGRAVQILDRRWNVPLHLLAQPGPWRDDWADLRPLHLHYHWLLRAQHRDLACATMSRLGVPADQLEWIREHAAGVGLSPEAARARPQDRASRQPRPLLITGMHRSGTSLVASVLQQAGLDIGGQLMGPGPGNHRGHFEDSGFYHLQEQMLAAAGSTALTADDEIAPPLAAVFEEWGRTLVERRAGLDLWGFKDPRTCLFLDFWRALLPDANYLFLYRHPVEVALSLRRRDTDLEVQLDPWVGIRSWELHNRRLLDFLERHRERCFLAQVPALTGDLPGFVHRVAAKLDLPLRDVSSTALFAPTELKSDLVGEELPEAWKERIPEALELYRRLEAAADLPATAPRTPRSAGEPATSAALATLFRDLGEARVGSGHAGAGGGRPAIATRWIAVERRGFARLLADLALQQRTVAELHCGLEAASSRRDELASNLEAIERSRAFRLVTVVWRLADRLRLRSSGGSSR